MTCSRHRTGIRSALGCALTSDRPLLRQVPRLTLQAAWGWDSGGRRGQCDALANKIIEESPRRSRRAYDQFEADLAARGCAALAYRSAPARAAAAAG